MSSTTSSDRLTLLSYATFNHHIPIHDHSDSTWRQQRKRMETMIALAIIRRVIWKINVWDLLCLELTFMHEALVLIPKHLGDVTDFVLGYFRRKLHLTTVSLAQMWGD